jgi:cytochrome c peroxidase
MPRRCRSASPPVLPVLLVLALLLPIERLDAAGLDEPITPLRVDLKLDPAKVDLGARLFNDKRLSRDGSVSCASCHDLAHGGADTRPGADRLSTGAGGVRHLFNTPTVFNAGFNFRQQWTGGADTIEELVDKIVTSKRVFDSNWPDVLQRLSADRELVASFRAGDPVRGMSRATISDALAVYVRSLVTPSRFDRWLRGDEQAISTDERRGYERFKAYGCVGCHQGMNVGGNMLQRFGAMNDYFADREKSGPPLTDADKGRFLVTNRPEDLHVFKVPSLRNVALTAPYFHDGSAPTLEQAVDVMFHYQLGRTAPPEDKTLIVKFLKSLTGEQFKE